MRRNCYTYENLWYNGRLGNQLFQIAATYCLAKLNGGICRFSPDWEYRDYFNVPDEMFDEIPHGYNVVDGGTNYFQQWNYIEPVKDEIWSWFQPNLDNLSADVKRFTSEMWAYNSVGGANCCIHVRRGDYLKHPKHFPIMTSRYFTSAVGDVKNRRQHVRFFIFSDDTEWCENNLSFFGLNQSDAVDVVQGTVRPVEILDRMHEPQDQWDLFKMGDIHMNEHIISNSTFSWWGAFLAGNKQAIYPNRWFGSAVPEHKTWEKIIVPGWRKFYC